jgi:hypothetical protein
VFPGVTFSNLEAFGRSRRPLFQTWELSGVPDGHFFKPGSFRDNHDGTFSNQEAFMMTMTATFSNQEAFMITMTPLFPIRELSW